VFEGTRTNFNSASAEDGLINLQVASRHCRKLERSQSIDRTVRSTVGSCLSFDCLLLVGFDDAVLMISNCISYCLQLVAESFNKWKVERLYRRLHDFSLASSFCNFPRTMVRLIMEI
jgi:hypothetical protein